MVPLLSARFRLRVETDGACGSVQVSLGSGRSSRTVCTICAVRLFEVDGCAGVVHRHFERDQDRGIPRKERKILPQRGSSIWPRPAAHVKLPDHSTSRGGKSGCSDASKITSLEELGLLFPLTPPYSVARGLSTRQVSTRPNGSVPVEPALAPDFSRRRFGRRRCLFLGRSRSDPRRAWKRVLQHAA